jgi:hypothetical protein
LHRIAPDAVVREFFHTNGHVHEVGLCGKHLCLVDTPKNWKTNPRLIQIARITLVKSEHTLKWNDKRYTLAGSDLISLSDDEKTLRKIAIDSPDTAREFELPTQKDCSIYDMAGSQGYAVLMRSNKTNGCHNHLIIDLTSGKTKVKTANQVTVHGAGRGRRRSSSISLVAREDASPKTSSVPLCFQRVNAYANQYQARVRLLRYAGKGYGVLGD